MHQPRHFVAPDRAAMLELMDAFPLAAIVVADGDGFEVNHVPLLAMAGEGDALVLRGHVARGNPLARMAADGRQAVAIFGGEQHYVSPGWYPSKAEHGRVVPTWNYSAVHLAGRATVHRDAAWLREAVTALTDRHEGLRPEPWAVTDAPQAFVDQQLRAIVGVELVVERVEAKAKRSQNRSESTGSV